MLPNRMQLNRQTEEQLKKLKAYTGITPNVAARLAFFRSLKAILDILLIGIPRSLMDR